MDIKKRNLIIICIGILSVIVSLYFDSIIVKGFSLIRNVILDDFFLGITFVSSGIILFFVLTTLFLWREHKRRWIIPLWATLGFSVVISFLLKVLIQRQRPFQLGIVNTISILQKSSHLIWNFSFPSFHAMFAFCAVPILSKEFPKFRYIWIIFASLIAISRVYFGLHFLSDILAGGIIGYLTGVLFMKLETENKFGEKIYKKIFKK